MDEIAMQIVRELIQYAVGGLVTFLVGYIKFQQEKIKLKEEAERQRDLKIDKVMSMMHASTQERILYLSEQYQRDGWISTDNLKTFMNLVDNYEALGFTNGVVNAPVEKVKALPNVPPKE